MLRNPHIGEGVMSPTEPDSTEKLFREIQQQILDLAERGGFVDVFGGGLTTADYDWIVSRPICDASDGLALIVPAEWLGRDSIP